MNYWVKIVFAITLCSVASCMSLAEDRPPSTEIIRRQWLEQTEKVFAEVSLFVLTPERMELKRAEHPILRYTNPVTSAFSEGALFLWLNGRRPAAAISTSSRDNGALFWELSSLADEPLQLNRAGKVVWQPPMCNRKSAPVPRATAPGPTAAGRLIQMRAIARRFQLREMRREQWQEGRLLSQPLYRWEDPAVGILDGALFGFAETTDPELLLLIEAKRDEPAAEAVWHFAVAKMTSSPVILSLDEKELWSGTGYWRNSRTPQDPYVEAMIVPPSNGAAAPGR
jgi:hypothetical protein